MPNVLNGLSLIFGVVYAFNVDRLVFLVYVGCDETVIGIYPDSLGISTDLILLVNNLCK